jgi:hypothetical protein
MGTVPLPGTETAITIAAIPIAVEPSGNPIAARCLRNPGIAHI